jgi:phosphonate transport system substrate-binding protein
MLWWCAYQPSQIQPFTCQCSRYPSNRSVTLKKILHSFILLALGCVLSGIAAASANEKIYTVAVVPQFASTQVYRDWTPLLEQLEQATGYRFKLLVYDEYSRFEREFEKGVPDLVYLNPYHMVIARQKQGYRPLLRDNSTLSGILVARQDGPIQKISDLNGKKIAFPSPNALGASLYLRALLAEDMHIKFNAAYANGHQNVYRQVLLGDVAAGGGVLHTLEKEPESVRSQLKVIFSTPQIAAHPLAAHPRVPLAVSKKITSAILAMRDNPEAARHLASVQLPHPVVADYMRDYAALVKLKLERYAVIQAQK